MDSINTERSYTEYEVTEPTTDFAIGFDNYSGEDKDAIHVTLDGVNLDNLDYTVVRQNAQVIQVTPAIESGVVRLQRETYIDQAFHTFTAGALFSPKSVDENFAQVRRSQQEVNDGFTFLAENTNGVVQASKEATAQAKAATVEATASAVRAESAADTAVQAVGSLQGVVDAATTATTQANAATTTATTAASQATTATTSAQNAAQAANTAKQEAAAAATNANAATVDTLAATGKANEAADVVANLVAGKVRAQDVSTADGSTQEVKNTGFRNELDDLPFEDGVLADTFVTMTANGVGAVPRNLRDVSSDTVNAKSFGAIPDTSLDVTVFLQAAIDYCTLNNKCLNIPAGEFLVNRLKITCDIKGERGTVLKNITTDNVHGNISIAGQTDLIVERVVFDGNVSADPDVWTEANYNDWEGGVALSISSSKRVVLKDCVTQNAYMSTLRIENCKDLVFLNHVAKRSRGNFGDGIYHRSSSGTVYINCRAEDFTRIGFVTETGSDRVSFYSCYATYGHNSSSTILSSGGEHNVGFWSENAANVSYDNCVADAVGYTGFTTTAGAYISPTGINGFTLNNCLSLSNKRGFSVSTYPKSRPDAQPTLANLTNCKAIGCTRAFSASLNVPTSRLTLDNCYAEMDFLSAGVQDATFALVGGNDTQAILNNCKIKHTSLDDVRVYNTSNNNLADFAAYSNDDSNTIEILINNLEEVDGGNLYFKYRDGERTIRVSDTKNIELIRCNLGGGSTFRNCSFFGFQPYPTGEVFFKECDVLLGSGNGQSGSHSSLYISNKARVVLEHCNISTEAGAYLWFTLAESSVVPYPLELLNSKITAEGKAVPYIIRFQDESTTKSNVLVKGCTFILSDALEGDLFSAYAPFVHAVRNGSTVTALDNIYDSKHNRVYKEGSKTKGAEQEAKWIKTWDSSHSIIRFANSGTTAERPNADTDKLQIGQSYYDTTLGNVVYWNGTDWVLVTLPETAP